jgi:hypothetical protein
VEESEIPLGRDRLTFATSLSDRAFAAAMLLPAQDTILTAMGIMTGAAAPA